MLDVLEKLMKQYKKSMQTSKVRAVGRSGSQSKNAKKTKITLSGEQESKVAKQSISKATTGLQKTVKGQFGKKVTEVLDKQKQTVDDF